jgi:peroxiredoxin
MNPKARRLLQWMSFGILALVVGYAGLRVGTSLRARGNAPVVVEAPDFPFLPGDAFPDVRLADSLGTEVGSVELVARTRGAVVLFLDPNCEGCSAMATRWEQAVSDGVIDPDRVFGVTSESAAANASYRAAHALSYPIYQDIESAFLERHGVVTYPMEVVVSASGMVQAVSTDSKTPIDGASMRALVGR